MKPTPYHIDLKKRIESGSKSVLSEEQNLYNNMKQHEKIEEDKRTFLEEKRLKRLKNSEKNDRVKFSPVRKHVEVKNNFVDFDRGLIVENSGESNVYDYQILSSFFFSQFFTFLNFAIF